MSRHRRLVVLTAALAAVSTMSACNQASTPQSQPTAVRGDEGGDIYGPLRAVYQADTDFVTAEGAMRRALENVVADCMKERGYDYTPVPVDEAQVRRDGLDLAYGTPIADPVQRTKEGYGVTTNLVRRTTGEGVDPQQRNRRGLSASEIKQFDTDLGQCSEIAGKTAWSHQALDQLAEASRQTEARIQSSPELGNARREWTTCMTSEVGVTYNDLNDPQLELDTAARPLYETPDATKVQALRAKELATAAADWACREKTINPALTEVRNRLESDFIEQHPELTAQVKSEMKKVISENSP